MTDLIVVPQATQWQRLKALVLDSVSSPITKRVYNLGLDEFFEWFGRAPRPGFTKATVSAWRVSLEARGLGSVSINVRITAVRKLAAEAADNGLLAPELAAGIARVKSAKSTLEVLRPRDEYSDAAPEWVRGIDRRLILALDGPREEEAPPQPRGARADNRRKPETMGNEEGQGQSGGEISRGEESGARSGCEDGGCRPALKRTIQEERCQESEAASRIRGGNAGGCRRDVSTPSRCCFYFFPQRAFAAFCAIALRRAAVSASARRLPPTWPPMRPIFDSSSSDRFSARAFPPFGPPSLPSATAWGFFVAISIA
jgi:hypothetical protein